METILTRLQQSFSAWRASPSPYNKRYSNPTLREGAIKCLEHHSYREVSEAIGVSICSLRSWKKSLRCHDQEAIDNSTSFVAMNFDPAKDPDETGQPLSLKISLPGGLIIQVESKSPQSSAALIIALNKESHTCSI